MEAANQAAYGNQASQPMIRGLPGTPCAPGASCHGGSLCINGLCVCRPGYRPSDGQCSLSKVDLGGTCFINEQCKNSGYCLNGVCACNGQNGNMHFSHGARRAHHRCPQRPIARPGEDCTKMQVCGHGSICGTFR